MAESQEAESCWRRGVHERLFFYSVDPGSVIPAPDLDGQELPEEVKYEPADEIKAVCTRAMVDLWHIRQTAQDKPNLTSPQRAAGNSGWG